MARSANILLAISLKLSSLEIARSEDFDYSDCNYFDYGTGTVRPLDVCYTNYDGSSTYQSIIYICEDGGNAVRLMFWYGDECWNGSPYVNTTVSFSNSNYSIHCGGSLSPEQCGMRIREYEGDFVCPITSEARYTESIYLRGNCNYANLYPSEGAWKFSCDTAASEPTAIYEFWSDNTERCQSDDFTTIAMDTCRYLSDSNSYDQFELTFGCSDTTTTTPPTIATMTATTSTRTRAGTGNGASTTAGARGGNGTSTTAGGGNDKSDNDDSGRLAGGAIVAIILSQLCILAGVVYYLYRKQTLEEKKATTQKNLEQIVVGSEEKNVAVELPDLSDNGRHPKLHFDILDLVNKFENDILHHSSSALTFNPDLGKKHLDNISDKHKDFIDEIGAIIHGLAIKKHGDGKGFGPGFGPKFGHTIVNDIETHFDKTIRESKSYRYFEHVFNELSLYSNGNYT